MNPELVEKYRAQTQYLNEGELALRLRQRYTSDDWWIFVPGGISGVLLSAAIEHEFYQPDTPANDDFEAACRVTADGVFAITLGRKTRASRRQLRKFLNRLGVKLSEDTTANVFVLRGSASADRVEAKQRLVQLNRLLTAPLINPILN